MAIQTLTRSTCDRCGTVDEREGAEASVPPVEWAEFSLSIRAFGSGWSGGNKQTEAILCPTCAAAVLKVLVADG